MDERGDLGGGVVARRQRISRRSPVPAAVAAGNTRVSLAGGRATEHHDQFQRAGPNRPASELGLGLNTMAREGWITRANRQRDQRVRWQSAELVIKNSHLQWRGVGSSQTSAPARSARAWSWLARAARSRSRAVSSASRARSSCSRIRSRESRIRRRDAN